MTTKAAILAANASVMTTPVGTAPSYSARAWVNFNGTGTVAIRASGNVSSITDNGTGDYTVNFTTALSDANYSAIGIVGYSAAVATDNARNITGKTWTTASFRFVNQVTGSVALDYEFEQIAVFR